MAAADRGRPGPRPRRTRTCSRATRRRCSSTATSTATRRRAPTRSCASSSSGRRAPTPPSRRCCKRNRIVFNVTSNPDGRVANTRANAAGYDLNRDLTIASQPEARLIRDLIVEHQADHHARPARLRQPDAAAPEHAAAQRQQRVRPLHQARRCRTRSTSRRGIAALGYPEVTRARIPFRDDAPGVWDDFPPIYVPSFAMLQSSIPYTIEAPLQPAATAPTAIAPRRHRHRRPRGRDQDLAEVHPGPPQPGHLRPGRGLPPRLGRRAAARHPGRLRPGLGPGGQVHDDVPARVRDPRRHAPALRAGRQAPRRPADRQRRPRDAGQGRVHRRRQHLPGRLLHPRHAPAQARPRELAAGAGHRPDRPRRRPLRRPGRLEPGPHVGRDRRHAVGRAARPSTTERVYSGAAASVSCPPANTDLLLDPQDAEDLLALNALLGAGREGARAWPTARCSIPRSARALAQAQADQARRDVQGARRARWSGASLDKVVVAYNGGSEVRDTLAALGFEGRAVTATTLTTTLTADVDVLLVGATLNPATLNAANRAALRRVPRPPRRRRRPRHGGLGVHHQRRPADRHRHGRRRASPAAWRTSSTTAARSSTARSRTRGSSRPSGTRTSAPTRSSSSPTPPIRSLSGWWRRSDAGTNGQAAGRRQGERRPRAGAGRQRRRPDRHQLDHPPARQGPAAAARPRDPVGRLADDGGRPSADGSVGRHRAGDAGADARRAGDVRRRSRRASRSEYTASTHGDRDLDRR